MKALRDFEEEHRELSLSDCAMMRLAFISCQGRRERDMYKVYEHFQTCNYCPDWIKNQEAIAKRTMASDADRQRVIDRMKVWDDEMLAERRAQECEREEAELYLTGGLGI